MDLWDLPEPGKSSRMASDGGCPLPMTELSRTLAGIGSLQGGLN